MSDESDAEAFNILKEDSGAIAYTESEDVHYDADKKEREHDRYPNFMPSSMKKDKKQIHMTYMVTQEHTADRFMKLFEGWWIRHQLKQYSSDPNYLSWKEMLELDTVGSSTEHQESKNQDVPLRPKIFFLRPKIFFLTKISRITPQDLFFLSGLGGSVYVILGCVSHSSVSLSN